MIAAAVAWGVKAGSASAKAVDLRWADSCSLRRGLPGLYGNDGNRAGWRTGEAGTAERLNSKTFLPLKA